MGFTFGFLVGDLVGSAIERANRRPARHWYPARAEPPPGWYRDPAGSSGLRWWDGERWTEHIAPATPDG